MTTLIERCEDAIDSSNMHLITKGDSADLPNPETIGTREWLGMFQEKHRPDNKTCHSNKILKKAVRDSLASPEIHMSKKIEECYQEAYGKPIQPPMSFMQFEVGEENKHKGIRPEFELIDDMMRY